MKFGSILVRPRRIIHILAATFSHDLLRRFEIGVRFDLFRDGDETRAFRIVHVSAVFRVAHNFIVRTVSTTSLFVADSSTFHFEYDRLAVAFGARIETIRHQERMKLAARRIKVSTKRATFRHADVAFLVNRRIGANWATFSMNFRSGAV